MQKKGRWDNTSNGADRIRWTVLQMSDIRPPHQGMPRPSGLLHMLRGWPSTMGLSTGYLGGKQTEESHLKGCRAEDPPETWDSKEEKGEAETNSTLVDGLIGEITSDSPKLVEIQQGLWQKLSAGDRVEMWEPENTNFFICGLTMASYIQIRGSI